MGEDAETVPMLQTPRLTLRRPGLADFADSAALWADPRVTRFITRRPATTEEVWARLLRYVGHWALLGFGYWVVQETASGRFVGEVGFADYHREMEPSLAGTPEIGWVIAGWAQGQGYATEAVRAAVGWGETRFAGARTVCRIDPANRPSLRVAEKCGYQEFARTVYKGAPVILFAR